MALRHGLIEIRAAALVAATSLAGVAGANGLEVAVHDREGAPVADVAVYAVPAERPIATAAATATMDQRNRAFVPHVLIVQTGTLIEFPNSDTVSHHVYSFSPAKRFELPLYKGSMHAPLRFDVPGTVVVGCNIHDDMLGFIHVVDTPYFDTTAPDGTVSLTSLPDGDYLVGVWTPRLSPDALPASARVTVHGGEHAALDFVIAARLLPERTEGGSSLTWRRY